ncbi:MAG: YfhO family protein [Acidobacteria bacterium]|nr:YfhO family protein [Acidobacteriota bacterium]MBV9475971.1 YfhO family protein [Acidobacteriota bacterium]
MPAAVLYLIVALALLFAWDRFVQRISRAAALALLLLPLCFTGRALLTARVYAPIDLPYMSEPLKEYAADYGIQPVHNGTLSDLYSQIIPWQSAVRQSFARGEWPLWNPYLLCGSILAANMQAAPYDLVQLAGMLLPHAQALTFFAAMTFFLAAFFTFAFARAIGLGEVPALIAAAGYAFSAMLAFFIGWPLAHAWAFLPFVLLGVRLVVRETNLRAAILLTLAFTLLVFAGHPESVLHIVACGAVYGLFELAAVRRWQPVALAAASGAVALGLTAVSLLPFFAAAPQTNEYDMRRNLYATGHFETTWEQIGKRAASSAFAFYGGQPERHSFTPLWDPTNVRAGSIVLAFALVALVVASRRRETAFFFGLAVVCAFAALNAWPVADLLHALPLFDITVNERLAIAAAFALSMLAAIAADAWPSTKPPAFAAAFVVLFLGGVLAYAANVVRMPLIRAGVPRELIVFLRNVELIPLAAAALLLFFRVPKRIAVPLVLGLVLLQRTIADGLMYPALPANAFYPRVPILRHIPQDRSQPFRIAGLYFSLVPDTAALYGLEDARGYEAMTFHRLTETFPLWSFAQPISFNTIEDLSKPFLSFLNVRYVLGGRDTAPPDGWRIAFEDRDSRLFENTRVLPRAFIPRRVRYERSATDVLRGMFENRDFADVAWITARNYPPHEIANGPGTLTLQRDGTSFRIHATMERDGWVVVSESAWPGWRAYVDGHRVEMQYANHAFLGIFVPAGQHDVRLLFRPEAFTRGRNLSIATLLAAIAFLALRNRLAQPRAVRVGE